MNKIQFHSLFDKKYGQLVKLTDAEQAFTQALANFGDEAHKFLVKDVPLEGSLAGLRAFMAPPALAVIYMKTENSTVILDIQEASELPGLR